MKYYVKVILENGLISQVIDVFSTMEEAKMFKNLAEKAGNKAEIYEIELIPAELEKLHEYKIVSKLSVEKLEPIGYYNEAHGFLHEEFDKDCYCQGGCSMEAVYTESQVKKLTDEKTVEKLQEYLLPYKKEMVQKIIDEKMQLVTADEFLKLHKESLTAIRENDKLQEQLNTAKKHIEHIIGTIKHDGHLGTIQTDWILPYLEKALAAIGKEGSGDE
ncbi:hypothetical protein EFK39_10630 [Lactococcus lactis subsp. lactis]|uniref:hypothetical protein n=1 Tax=Lactococcus lactis TaxID=1358 RepID=UPI00223B2392|nr:hypothetical protein [Lactococcus lactis]MCT0056795.1 hypothetical protein [Lactococcus lactis subsp. lactis]